jgi:hypothetical protein
MKTPQPRPRSASRPASLRSRITNGKELLPGIDQRSPQVRRYRDVLAALISDRGGLDQLSEARLHLCRRFAAQVLLAEEMEARLCSGQPIDIAEHCAISNTLGRLAGRIGLSRAMKAVPNLQDYIAAHDAAQQQPEETDADAAEE